VPDIDVSSYAYYLITFGSLIHVIEYCVCAFCESRFCLFHERI